MTSTARPSAIAARPRTQTDQVLDYLRNTGPLDQFTAKDELGVLRLGARIWDLKQRGYAIRTELIEAPTEYGGTRIAQYSLVRDSLVRDAADRDDAPGAAAQGDPAEGEPPIEAELPAAGRGLDPRTLDDALWTFGDRAAALGVTPTVREYQHALGAASESVAHRWLRVLEREGYLSLDDGPAATAHRTWRVTAPGYERLYVLERARRVALETGLARRVAADASRLPATPATPEAPPSHLERRAS